MGKRKQTEYTQGHATSRRTMGDYMGVLLDAVTLDERRGVVIGAFQSARPNINTTTETLTTARALPTVDRSLFKFAGDGA